MTAGCCVWPVIASLYWRGAQSPNRKEIHSQSRFIKLNFDCNYISQLIWHQTEFILVLNKLEKVSLEFKFGLVLQLLEIDLSVCRKKNITIFS